MSGKEETEEAKNVSASAAIVRNAPKALTQDEIQESIRSNQSVPNSPPVLTQEEIAAAQSDSTTEPDESSTPGSDQE